MDSISTASLVLFVTVVSAQQQAQLDAVTTETAETHYFTSWAVEVGGANGLADELARKHGLINRGQVSSYNN